MASTRKTSKAKKTTEKGEDEEKGETWECKNCETPCDKQEKMLECEYCGENFCIKCLKITEQVYKMLNNAGNMFHWYCTDCNEKVKRTPNVERDIEERCREYCASVEGRLKDIEEKLETNTNEEQVKEIVKKCLKTEEKSEETIEKEKDNITDTINKLMDERSTETKERETRRNNVIIFGQKECGETLK